MAYLDAEFLLISNENYLDTDFSFHVPEYHEINFLLISNEEYLDKDFYFSFHIVVYRDIRFLFPGSFQSYRERPFRFIAVDQDFEDIDFLNYVPDHYERTFNAVLSEYLDSNFLLYTSDIVGHNFLNYVPDHHERSFFVPIPDHEDIDFLVDVTPYLDIDFFVDVPHDEWYDVGFIAQTLGRGSGDFGYEYDEWDFFIPTPKYLEHSFIFNQDVQLYIESFFSAVLEGVSNDISFIIHSDITYGYIEPSFVIVNITDNLVERALIQVSSWVRRPGRRPAIL